MSRKEQIPGWIERSTYALQTWWTFKTIPSPGEFGSDTWENDSASYLEVTVWSMFSADEELGHLYAPTNTIAPDYYGGHRLGNNLLPKPCWPCTLPRQTRLALPDRASRALGLRQPGGAEPDRHHGRRQANRAFAQITKQGFVYTFDRVTGAPVWPIEERAVLALNVPAERAAPTQPFPTRPAAFEYQGATLDDP